MTAPPPRQLTEEDILQRVIGERLARFTQQLVNAVGMTVQRGPFKGMTLPTKASWSGGYLSAKILGAYESELHDAIEQGIKRAPAVVVNVGCAEGFYAIGLARRLPNARVFAFDISREAQDACASAAEENAVTDRVTIGGECTADVLASIARGARGALIVLDCEGAELPLLPEHHLAAYAKTDLIIELHDFVNKEITPTLTTRLSTSHKVKMVREGARDLGAYEMLAPLGSFDRALLVNEFRPSLMHWMVARAR